MKIGLAGGIGSGKSYVAARLLLHGIKVYDCDSAAKRLMRTSTQLREQLTALIGADCYESDGDDGANGSCRLNKAAVSRFLLASPTNQQAINAIVHPAVFADFEESGLQWLESGIMFESGANRHVDRVIVVTAPKEVRLQRIMQRDGISREQAQQWIACQWPQSKVRRLADYEIVNDGQQDIDKQLNIILEQLCNKPF
jgi:dephospho-CoA kinase